MIERRQFFVLTAGGAVALVSAEKATACTILPTDRTPFNDRRSRAALGEFVAFLNDAYALPDDELTRRYDEMRVAIEAEWVDERVGPRASGNISRDYLFVKEFRLNGGRPDPRPIEVEHINLVRRLGNRATYQFTLKRYSYHPADPEGCNGLFVHDEYYGYDRISCLATFEANRLRTVRRFPEWYL